MNFWKFWKEAPNNRYRWEARLSLFMIAFLCLIIGINVSALIINFHWLTVVAIVACSIPTIYSMEANAAITARAQTSRDEFARQAIMLEGFAAVLHMSAQAEHGEDVTEIQVGPFVMRREGQRVIVERASPLH